MMKNNNLDEQQEQVLLRIEHNGCWFAFWALLISLVVQFILYGNDANNGMQSIAAEWIIFMCLAIYLTAGCIKNGIWDRRFKADTKTNVIFSVVAGVAAGVMNFIRMYRNYSDKLAGCIAGSVFSLIFTLVLTFLVLELCRILYVKKHHKIEEEPEEE